MIRSFKGKTPRIAHSAYVSEAACIIGDVEIGEHSNVLPGAVIRADMGSVRIGSYVSVEDNCVVHAGSRQSAVGDLTIGDKVIIGHGAVLNCRSIGNSVLIGMNATILLDAEIGSRCIIAACALVREGMKIPDDSFVVGIPGKIVGPPTQDQLWWVEGGVKDYEELMKQYKKEGGKV